MVISGYQFGGSRDERGIYAVLGLFLIAVLIPTACLLYFINEAIDSQRRLARQQLGEAYRGQLGLVTERIDSFWLQRARELDKLTESESPALYFEHCVRDGLADSVICLEADGRPAYPSLAAPPKSDPTLRDARWAEARQQEDRGKKAVAAEKYKSIASVETDPSTAARAWQAAIRCLVTGGRQEDALRLIEQLQEWRLSYATSLDGRIVVADEYRLAMQLLPAGDGRQKIAAQLFSFAQNYSRAMPSAQRLFLMDWLRSVSKEPRYRTFPTYQAERLADRVLSSGHAIPGEAKLQLTGIGDVWKLTPKSGRIIALFGTDTAVRNTRALLDSPKSSRNPAFALTPPDRPLPPHSEAMILAGSLPGWQISLDQAGPAVWSSGAGRRTASYLWIGFLAIATMGAVALAAGHMLRLQMRIAHLKTDLVAAVSHELKTPLASMKLLVESLLSAEQFEPKRTREYLQMVARENSRLSRLIDNFLTFSRMERNRGKFEFARFQPQSVVHAAMESIGDRYLVELDIQPNLPPLYADEDALVTVLLNLLDNAYKYTGDDRRIVLRVHRVEGRVCFTVEDNGIGIAERDQKKIFRRFFQVDRRLARQAGGVGLGLSIVEYIVKAHHGGVSVTSKPGVGSKFSILLSPQLFKQGCGGMNSGRILIVEDEPSLMRGLKDAFTDAGFQVVCAADGQRGLELAIDARPDLILLDIMLPKVNGYEICRAVRGEDLEMPIIMLTAKGQEEDIILGLNLGADDYVTKPFKLGELMARAKAFLRRSQGKPLKVVRFGEFELNLTAHALLRQGREVELTAKEFMLLAFFAGRVGRALARNDILSAVWGGSVAVTPRSVDRCVTTLRAKIEDNPREPVFIQTIRDIGYRFEIDNSTQNG